MANLSLLLWRRNAAVLELDAMYDVSHRLHTGYLYWDHSNGVGDQHKTLQSFATGIMWAAPVATNYSWQCITDCLRMPTGSGGGGISERSSTYGLSSSGGKRFLTALGSEIDAGYSSKKDTAMDN